MTVLRTVRAAEPTAAFSPQRKCKTGGSNPSPATIKTPRKHYFGVAVFVVFMLQLNEKVMFMLLCSPRSDILENGEM